MVHEILFGVGCGWIDGWMFILHSSSCWERIDGMSSVFTYYTTEEQDRVLMCVSHQRVNVFLSSGYVWNKGGWGSFPLTTIWLGWEKISPDRNCLCRIITDLGLSLFVIPILIKSFVVLIITFV